MSEISSTNGGLPKPSSVEEAIQGNAEPNATVGLLTQSSICLLMFLIGLYTTMDSVIFIPIANSFNALPRAEWIINGYLITTTAFQPIYAKTSDIFGRVPMMLFAALMLLIGSIVAATAQSINTLIAGRAIQGVGSAGMYTMVNVLIADLFSERDRGRFMGISSGMWAFSASGAVVLGGAVTQLASWRIAFWINVPICVIAATVIALLVKVPRPQGSIRDKLGRVDFGGSVICLLSIILVLLGLSWGGRDYAWGSAAVICSLAFGILAWVLFIVYEHRVPREPIVPTRLLRTRNVALAFIGHLFFGAVTYAPLMFVPQWSMLVKSSTPITSGLYTLPFTLSELLAVVVSGIWVTRTGRYRECVWLSGILLLAGLTPFVILNQESGLGLLVGLQIIAGIGFGLAIITLILTAQVSAIGEDSAAATSACIFMRSLGAILVVAVLSSVNGNKLRTEFDRIAGNNPEYIKEIRVVEENQAQIHSLGLPDALVKQLIDAFMKGMQSSFVALVPFSALFVLTTLGIKHVPLQTVRKPTIS